MNDMRGIGSRTASKTDGMFCYPRLVLDFITSSLCYSLEEVKESIAELPQGLFDFNHSMVDKTSEDVRQTIDSLAPYPRLLRGIWEALGIKTGEEKDVQSRKQRKGSLTTLLEDYQEAIYGVSAKDLKQSKGQFSSSVFTCGFRSCRQGFGSSRLPDANTLYQVQRGHSEFT
ncbi:hypothetical protein MGG_18066 [Pyricularia oryzae 70-15]|uniref:Uncharacterized protein n=1 Tax=Pyricularia oryzae (strain 70-15 / ATCC MYA-4617 / FGSC 8958) TaxID=242507 RepID=G4NKX9_PYRO7|nr:uncharacterized protein MGG_18066 [Pyricularia oryzae 70-15]EHA46671.1 hypothetical protein MGG_18066 [Pyricularia oryzae 70-15]